MTTSLSCMVIVAIFCGVDAIHKHEEMPAKRLHHDLFHVKGYNKLIRPSGNVSRALLVRLGMRLTQILDLDEKRQIMTTSIWLKHVWEDKRLTWDPADYGGVIFMKIPSQDLWRPDIVLYNNADGDFTITLFTKATVHHTGILVWEPPAIMKSFCPIDVEFFPFDLQLCFMKFGTWSYDGDQVDLHHFCTSNYTSVPLNEKVVIDSGIDLTQYYPNNEWDIINVTAQRKVKKYTCCPTVFPDVMFNVTLRRRTLFYSVNLIVPCMAISCLCVLVFYLPSDSCEKITLSVSILLALTVFFLLLSDLIPPTSFVIPLIGKYLLFTMLVVTLSICLTVFVLSIHYRTPSTHTMSPLIKRVLIEILPRLLLMRRPDIERQSGTDSPPPLRSCNGIESGEGSPLQTLRKMELQPLRKRDSGDEGDADGTYTRLRRSPEYPPEVVDGLKGMAFIAERMEKDDRDELESRDWKYAAMVLDRLFLYIFTIGCFVGSLSIFLYAPSLYDPREPLGLSRVSNHTCITSVRPI